MHIAHKQAIFKKFSTLYLCDKKIIAHNLPDLVAKYGQTINDFIIPKKLKPQLVGLIGGGMSSERDVSYSSCTGIAKSLMELGYQVIFIDMGADIAEVLVNIKPDVVFNGLHGTFGEDGNLPGLLNILSIKYTGCGVLASSLAFNKKFSYKIFVANKILTPESITVKKSDNITTDPMPRPYVIKPLCEGSSVGIEIIEQNTQFNFADYHFTYGDEVMISRYIQGREIQVAVLSGKALGALEIKLLQNKKFYDYETKYTNGFAEHIFPAQLTSTAYNQVLNIAEKVNDIFACSGMVRVEFIYDEKIDKFYLLELNTHPGMTPLSICPEIAGYQGISYTDLVHKIIQDAKCEIPNFDHFKCLV